jgi:hypothetical protein
LKVVTKQDVGGNPEAMASEQTLGSTVLLATAWMERRCHAQRTSSSPAKEPFQEIDEDSRSDEPGAGEHIKVVGGEQPHPDQGEPNW